jgi:hypothetical protein
VPDTQAIRFGFGTDTVIVPGADVMFFAFDEDEGEVSVFAAEDSGNLS